MARRDQHLGIGENRRVDADDVISLLHVRPPPGVLHVAQHVHAEWPVVVRRPEPAVNLRRREDEAATFAQVHHRLEERFALLCRALIGGALLGAAYLRYPRALLGARLSGAHRSTSSTGR